MLELGLKSLLAYLVGSVSGSLLLGRLRGGVDIRLQGSGNAGGTNALRTQGLKFGLAVLGIDIAKGWLAVAAIPRLPMAGTAAALDPWVPIVCAVGVVLGHVYPVWHDFRGGKGAATFVGVLLGLRPDTLIPMLIVWLTTVFATGFVGLATILAGFTLPVYLIMSDSAIDSRLLILGCAMGLFAVYTHRANLSRMKSGTEVRVQRLWLGPQ